MIFKRTLAGAALFAGLLLGAGCELITAPDRTLIETGGGGTGGNTGGSTGGTVSTGGNPTTGGGGSACTPVDDSKECTDDVCEDGVPVNNPKTAGDACATGVCDGTGECVECLQDTNCTAPEVCDTSNNTCVPATCMDMSPNGSETDEDCGGPDCADCDDGLKCLEAGDCKSGVCADDGNGQLVCQTPLCGDGVINGADTCDDGNTDDCDGCRGDCTALETGCGDGFACGTEACDDGNTDNCDGCRADCSAQETGCGDGFTCGTEVCDDGNDTNDDGCDDGPAGPTGTCTITGCGNGVVNPGEECDDSNQVNGDGCDNNCKTTACGNGITTTGETCDDGNTTAIDGCSATCATESGWDCTGTPSTCTTTCGDGIKVGAEACDDDDTDANDGCSATCTVETGWDCTGAPLSTCSAICGDGLLVGAEMCDDNDTTGGDGCSATCVPEFGFDCTGAPSVCVTTCGDGEKASTEGCDDTNTTAGDGCSATCAVEAGFTCSGQAPSVCVTTCGDGIKAGAEACDDTNTTAGDGCSATCTVEAGYACTGSTPSVCAAVCGDGLIVGVETCDDTNTAVGDGCNSTCKVEAGWTCTGMPSTCSAICGDNLLKGPETCDDGNTTAGDCCSATCQIEAGCETEPNNACGATNTMPAFAGSPATTQIKGNVKPGATDVDLFAFTIPGTKPTTIKVETYFGTPGTCASTAVNDTFIELRGTNCTSVLASDDDDANGFCSLIDTTVGDTAQKNLTPGTYFVDVEHSTGSTDSGTYTLLVSIVSVCGDSTVLAATEGCDDGNNTAGDGCSATCTVEANFICSGSPSVCVPACGNGAINGAEACDDGNTTNGDGCSSACAVESGFLCSGTPSLCVTPEINCNDGLDNNGKGGIDAADPSCALPAYFTACGAGEKLIVVPSLDTPKTIVDNVPAGSDSVVTVAATGQIARATALVNISHLFDGDVNITLRNPANTAFDLSSGNGGSGDNYVNTLFDQTCATNITAGSAPFTNCFKPEATIAPLVGTSPTGTWTLNAADVAAIINGTLNNWRLALCVATCGDGTKGPSEACDDSNTTAGDGCSATCTVEAGYTCTGTTPSVCAPTCGDGIKTGAEACDDANVVAADGCSATCTVETGFNCTGQGAGSCTPICGDGLIKTTETCDDTNTTAGDGCSATCATESGFTCTGEPSVCTPL